MKREQLLEAIGGVDEQFLMETEQTAKHSGRSVRRIVLVAAIIAVLALTAAASTGLFSLPIGKNEIKPDETVAPFAMDADGNIIPEGVQGLKVTMEVETNAGAPAWLEEIYSLELPKGWTYSGGGSAGDGYRYATMEMNWRMGDKPGELRLHQSVVSYYVEYIYGENCVDTLPKLSPDDLVTSETVSIAGIQALKVTIPELPWHKEGKDGSDYCAGGETRLYWTDGDYMLQLDYPYWMKDSQVEKILARLEKKDFVPLTPQDYGTINPDRIADIMPVFEVEQGNTGTTAANSVMGLGRFVYNDGYIYFGEVGCIYRYDLQNGETKKFILSNEHSDPEYMFATENYICYADGYSGLMAMKKDGSGEEVIYEGIGSSSLYAEDMILYTADGILNLQTGEVTRLPEGILSYYTDDTYIYAVPEDDGHYFLRSQKDSLDFEKMELSFFPIKVLADGEDLYFTEGGQSRHYQVIRYHDGVETRLPISAVEYQVLDGHVIYRCEDEAGRSIKSYNLQTGEIKVLHDEGFNFSILQERYICLLCADSNGRGYYCILDWETGECVEVKI